MRRCTGSSLSHIGQLDLWFGSGQVAGDNFILKAGAGMGAIAKRLVLRLAASAQADHGASAKSKLLTLRIENLEVPLNADRAVVVNGNFCIGHELPMLTRLLHFFAERN